MSLVARNSDLFLLADLDQSKQPHSLVGVFVIHCLESGFMDLWFRRPSSSGSVSKRSRRQRRSLKSHPTAGEAGYRTTAPGYQTDKSMHRLEKFEHYIFIIWTEQFLRKRIRFLLLQLQ